MKGTRRRRTMMCLPLLPETSGDPTRVDESKARTVARSPPSFSLVASVLLLLVAQSWTPANAAEQEHLSNSAHYCIGAHRILGEECFPLKPIPYSNIGGGDSPSTSGLERNDQNTSNFSLGKICMEVVKMSEGDLQLEVNYQAGDGWTMSAAHFWLGDDIGSVPVTFYEDELETRNVWIPDASKFPFRTRLDQFAPDSILGTSTYWDEILQANEKVLCDDRDKEQTGMRAFAGQAVLQRIDDPETKVTAFATLQLDLAFGPLETYFITCTCVDPTEQEEFAEVLTPEAAEMLKQAEADLDSTLEEEEVEEAEAESESKETNSTGQSPPTWTPTSLPKSGDKEEEEEEWVKDRETNSTSQSAPTLAPTLRPKSDNETSQSSTGVPTLAPSPDPDNRDVDLRKEENADVGSVQVGPAKGSDSTTNSGDTTDSNAVERSADDIGHEGGPVVVVKADELEVAISFLVVMPNQKRYIDMLLDEETMHKAEVQIEASPELHQAWHLFVAQIMSDFNIPAVNVSKSAWVNHEIRDRRRNLKAVTVAWIEDSPDLFKFLIATPCPAHVLETATRGIAMGTDPKAVLRGHSDDASSKATCYKAFGKYKILHLTPEDALEENEDFGDGRSRQEVCYDIFHIIRQALNMEKLGEELPDNVPFLIQGGKPESCLPTGLSVVLPKPDDIETIEPTMESMDYEVEKSILYELRNEDGTWNGLRVIELVAYLSTSILMMSLCITIYCFLLPKIDLESRNRVTDDWSQVSLRPQPIKGSKKEPAFFPWLE